MPGLDREFKASLGSIARLYLKIKEKEEGGGARDGSGGRKERILGETSENSLASMGVTFILLRQLAVGNMETEVATSCNQAEFPVEG